MITNMNTLEYGMIRVEWSRRGYGKLRVGVNLPDHAFFYVDHPLVEDAKKNLLGWGKSAELYIADLAEKLNAMVPLLVAEHRKQRLRWLAVSIEQKELRLTQLQDKFSELLGQDPPLCNACFNELDEGAVLKTCDACSGAEQRSAQ